MRDKPAIRTALVDETLNRSRSSMTSAAQTPAPVEDAGRRQFLRRGGTLAGGALAAGVSLAHANPLDVPASNKGYGKPIAEDDYGMPSKYQSRVRRRRTDVLKNRQNFSDWSMTPLQDQYGIVTPNG